MIIQVWAREQWIFGNKRKPKKISLISFNFKWLHRLHEMELFCSSFLCQLFGAHGPEWGTILCQPHLKLPVSAFFYL